MPDFKGWDDDAVAELKRMHAEGRTFGDIDRVLGCGRSAAIGKAHRLGLSRDGASAPEGAGRRDRARKPGRPSGTTSSFKTAGGRVYPMPPSIPLPKKLEPSVVPETARPFLTRRTFGECAFPVGEPARPGEQLSCCAPSGERRYCPGHLAVMFTKAPPARMERLVA